MNKGIYFNAFTRVILNGVELREMQVANPKEIYQLSDADRVRPEIDISVSAMHDTNFVREIYNSAETGYFQKNNNFYYRNCNVANDLNWPDVFYRGRLPGSLLRVRVKTFQPLEIDVQVTANYLRESRSRLSRIPSIDESINNILLVGAIRCGFLPMHAAAIEVELGGRRCSLLFMGLPNTGKTQLSVATRRALSGDYLAEDICFARADASAIFGGPYTLDENKIQSYDELRATKYIGAPIRAIVMLQRTVDQERLQSLAAGSPEVADFISNMNRYEFEWNHDLIVRHLLIGGTKHGMSSTHISRCYEQGIQQLGTKVSGYKLSGLDPRKWTSLLLASFRDSGLVKQATVGKL